LEDAGLQTSIDAVGNIVGRWVPHDADSSAAAVAAGSHLDSVPEGGIFDGPLGVYGALEAVRALQAASVNLSHPVEVVCFTEEEGHRFSKGVLGSSVATGKTDVETALKLSDDENILGETFADIGFQGDGRVDAADWDAWLELHPEQGTKLESANITAGVVSTITGTFRYRVEIQGEANHAGTTSMSERRDALPAASEIVLEIESAVREQNTAGNSAAVGTVGGLTVDPNAINIVPGRVEMEIDIRDVNYATMEAIEARLNARVEEIRTDRDVAVKIERPYEIKPVDMSDRCRAALKEAGSAASVSMMSLHSGAGHDTMQIATLTDAGVLFAPSQDGESHNPREWTDWADCKATTQVLAGAIAILAAD